MTNPTRIRRQIKADRAAVYQALLDADAIAAWKVPDGMSSQVHFFEAREGGRFRVSLTYDDPTATGKTSAQTDTYQGHFVRLVPNQQVIETMAFETDDPAISGEMTIHYTLSEAEGGTELIAVHEHLPPGVSAEDNETGWRMALDKLASYVEARQPAAG